MAPSGLTAKPAAHVRSANMNPVVSFTPAKNCFEMTAAKEPYRKKSYHSNTVPRLDAMMTRRWDWLTSAA